MSWSSSSSSSRSPGAGCLKYLLDDIMYVTNEFGERKILGKGGEGTVYLAEIYLGSDQKDQKTLVAAKHLKEEYTHQFEQEIKTVSKIRHHHLVSLLGYCDESGQKILLYEYMGKGSLRNYVEMESSTNLSWVQCLNICLGAALGLHYLHTSTTENPAGITHRDVKPDNILLDENWVAKVSDFGAFKLSTADPAVTTRLIGTRGYIAPEYNASGRVTTKIDVYSFGAVMFQVLCRKMPWDRPVGEDESTYFLEEDENLALWAQQNVHDKLKAEMIPDDDLKAFSAIIGKSLQANPGKRIAIADVVEDLQNILDGFVLNNHRQFSLQEIKEGTNNWKNVTRVEGLGTVYLADCYLGLGSGGRTRVVVKEMRPQRPFFSKIPIIISRIQHANVVSLIGSYTEHGGDRTLLVYEYMQKGDLDECLRKRSNGDFYLTWKQWLKICIGIARGLQYLDTKTLKELPNGLIYGNVFPRHILLDRDWVAKVFVGFTLISILGGGTLWAASRASTLLNFANILLEVLSGKRPWRLSGKDVEHIEVWAKKNVHSDIKEEITKDCLESFAGIIAQCRQHDKTTMDQVVSRLENCLELQERTS